MLVVQCAGVAQLVELLICNQPVAGSSPVTSFQAKRPKPASSSEALPSFVDSFRNLWSTYSVS